MVIFGRDSSDNHSLARGDSSASAGQWTKKTGDGNPNCRPHRRRQNIEIRVGLKILKEEKTSSINSTLNSLC